MVDRKGVTVTYAFQEILDESNRSLISGTFIDFNKENNQGDLKFEVGNHVRILKYKNLFRKGYTSN